MPRRADRVRTMARILLLLMDGFDDEEVRNLRRALEAEGQEVVLLGPKRGERVTGQEGDEIVCERDPLQVNLNTCHMVVVPGGPGADQLAESAQMVNMVYSMAHKGRVVVAVGRGVLTLPPADKEKSPNPIATGTKVLDGPLLKGRVVTGDPDVREQLEKAGAKWGGGVLQADGVLVTARSAKGADLDRLMEELAPRFMMAARPVVSRIL